MKTQKDGISHLLVWPKEAPAGGLRKFADYCLMLLAALVTAIIIVVFTITGIILGLFLRLLWFVMRPLRAAIGRMIIRIIKRKAEEALVPVIQELQAEVITAGYADNLDSPFRHEDRISLTKPFECVDDKAPVVRTKRGGCHSAADVATGERARSVWVLNHLWVDGDDGFRCARSM
jgi:hypothetical protein